MPSTTRSSGSSARWKRASPRSSRRTARRSGSPGAAAPAFQPVAHRVAMLSLDSVDDIGGGRRVRAAPRARAARRSADVRLRAQGGRPGRRAPLPPGPARAGRDARRRPHGRGRDGEPAHDPPRSRRSSAGGWRGCRRSRSAARSSCRAGQFARLNRALETAGRADVREPAQRRRRRRAPEGSGRHGAPAARGRLLSAELPRAPAISDALGYTRRARRGGAAGEPAQPPLPGSGARYDATATASPGNATGSPTRPTVSS